jgi:hypothetical protein
VLGEQTRRLFAHAVTLLAERYEQRSVLISVNGARSSKNTMTAAAAIDRVVTR